MTGTVGSVTEPVPTWSPEPEHTGNLIRLNRLLEGSAGQFALIFAIYNQPAYRDRLIKQLLNPCGEGDPHILNVNTISDITQLEEYLENNGNCPSPLHLIGLDQWLACGGDSQPAGLERLHGFNRHRDYIAKLCQRPLVLWLLEHQARKFAQEAPDAWEWRASVFDFTVHEAVEIPLLQPLGQFEVELEKSRSRITELQEFIAQNEHQLKDREKIILWGNLGDLLELVGDWEGAAQAYKWEKAACDNLDDRRGAAVATAKIARLHWQQGKSNQALDELRYILGDIEYFGDNRLKASIQGRIADILQSLGQLSEALRIRQEDQLPIFSQLHDMRSMAITQGRISDLLLELGQTDEALHLLQDEVLPTFQNLGDSRSAAITQGKIVDILHLRRQNDEALRLLQYEILPTVKKIGDLRSIAVNQGRIVDIFIARGQHDEALHLLLNEVLPTFHKLGDVRSIAVSQMKIADILQSRGQLDEALHLLGEEVLPTYQQLGDVRSIAVSQMKIADILRSRDQLDEALHLLGEEVLPTFHKLGDVRSIAVSQMKIADILRSRGQLDEALRLLGEKVLPAYQQLGNTLLAAITQGKIADILHLQGKHDEALSIYQDEVLPSIRKLGEENYVAAVQSKINDILENRK